jgi:hypothetical protein
MYRRVLGLVALLALVCAVGCTGKKKSDGPGSGTTPVAAATPEDAFKQYQKAEANNDYRGAAALMTPDLLDKVFTQKVLPGAVLMAGFAEALGGEEGKKQAKNIYEILEKHGISKDDLKTAMKDKKGGALKELSAKAKDKPALTGELVEALKKSRKETEESKKKDAEEKEATLAATLKDVKTQGDTATATLVHKKLDRKTGKREEKEDPIKFKKIDGNWRIDEIPMD